MQPGAVVGFAHWMDNHPGFSTSALMGVASLTCGLLTIENPPLALIMATACGIYAAFYGSVFESTVRKAASYKGNNRSGPYPVCVSASFDLYYWTGIYPQGMRIARTGYWGYRPVWVKVNGQLWDITRWMNTDTNSASSVVAPGTV